VTTYEEACISYGVSGTTYTCDDWGVAGCPVAEVHRIIYTEASGSYTFTTPDDPTDDCVAKDTDLDDCKSYKINDSGAAGGDA